MMCWMVKYCCRSNPRYQNLSVSFLLTQPHPNNTLVDHFPKVLHDERHHNRPFEPELIGKPYFSDNDFIDMAEFWSYAIIIQVMKLMFRIEPYFPPFLTKMKLPPINRHHKSIFSWFCIQVMSNSCNPSIKNMVVSFRWFKLLRTQVLFPSFILFILCSARHVYDY